MSNEYVIRGRSVVFPMLLCIVVGAIAPLSVKIHDITIYTPYVPFSVMAALAFSVWLLHPRRTIRRLEEVAFVGAQFLTVPLSFLSVLPNEALGASMVAVYAAGVYLLVRYVLRIGTIERHDLIKFAVIAFILLTIVALFQIVFQKNIGVVSTYYGSSSAGGTYADAGKIRISSTFSNANVFGQVYTIYGAILVTSLLFRFGAPRLILAISTSVVMTSIVAASLSRSGLLYAVVVQAIIYAYWITHARKVTCMGVLKIGASLLVASLIIGGGVLLILPADQLMGLSRYMDSSDGGRLALAVGALHLLSDPFVMLFGVGSGQFFRGITEYGIIMPYKEWRELSDINSSVHNWLLQICTENGLIVLVLYVYAVARTAVRGWSIREMPGGWMPASLGLIVSALYLVPLQLTTAGTTPWVLTPVAIILAWIQNEYDEIKKRKCE